MQPFAVASTQDATKHSPGMFFPNQRFGASVSCTSCNSLSGCNRRNVIKLHLLGNKRLEDRFGGPLFAPDQDSTKQNGLEQSSNPFCFILFDFDIFCCINFFLWLFFWNSQFKNTVLKFTFNVSLVYVAYIKASLTSAGITLSADVFR
mgnify:CR=1 FL=1